MIGFGKWLLEEKNRDQTALMGNPTLGKHSKRECIRNRAYQRKFRIYSEMTCCLFQTLLNLSLKALGIYCKNLVYMVRVTNFMNWMLSLSEKTY